MDYSLVDNSLVKSGGLKCGGPKCGGPKCGGLKSGGLKSGGLNVEISHTVCERNVNEPFDEEKTIEEVLRAKSFNFC